ncbi:MAG: PQQ-binding-like beta-propeller repeat protein, partial [Pseudomonadota bacterium]
PVLAGDHLVLVSSVGELVKVAPTDGEIIETKKIKEGSLVSPVVSGEKIYVLTQKGKLRAYQ